MCNTLKRAITLLLLAVNLPTLAAEQPYPSKPIRMVVAFPPGGLADVVARIIFQPVTQQLGHNIIIDNRPGALGAIAGDIVARAAPDGYTLLFTTSSTMSAASLHTSVPCCPMATPIWAWRRAGESLMPSPVIATIAPPACSAWTMRSFCSGGTRA